MPGSATEQTTNNPIGDQHTTTTNVSSASTTVVVVVEQKVVNNPLLEEIQKCVSFNLNKLLCYGPGSNPILLNPIFTAQTLLKGYSAAKKLIQINHQANIEGKIIELWDLAFQFANYYKEASKLFVMLPVELQIKIIKKFNTIKYSGEPDIFQLRCFHNEKINFLNYLNYSQISMPIKKMLIRAYADTASERMDSRFESEDATNWYRAGAVGIVDDVLHSDLLNTPELQQDVDQYFIDVAQAIYAKNRKYDYNSIYYADRSKTPGSLDNKAKPLFYYSLPEKFRQRLQSFKSDHPHYKDAQRYLAVHYRTELLKYFNKYLKVGPRCRTAYRLDRHSYAAQYYSFDYEDASITSKIDNAADTFLRAIISKPDAEVTLPQLQTALNTYFKAREGFWTRQYLNLLRAPSRKSLEKIKNELTATVTIFTTVTDAKSDAKNTTATTNTSYSTATATMGTAANVTISAAASAPTLPTPIASTTTPIASAAAAVVASTGKDSKTFTLAVQTVTGEAAASAMSYLQPPSAPPPQAAYVIDEKEPPSYEVVEVKTPQEREIPPPVHEVEGEAVSAAAAAPATPASILANAKINFVITQQIESAAVPAESAAAPAKDDAPKIKPKSKALQLA